MRALSPPKVVREGYFNLRYHQEPECPHHIYPFKEDDGAVNKPEIVIFRRLREELFPGEESTEGG